MAKLDENRPLSDMLAEAGITYAKNSGIERELFDRNGKSLGFFHAGSAWEFLKKYRAETDQDVFVDVVTGRRWRVGTAGRSA